MVRTLIIQGETADWDLNQSAERLLTEKFEANQKDEFIIVDKDVGKVTECFLHIKSHALSKNSKWFLNYLSVKSCKSLKEQFFMKEIIILEILILT